MTKLNGIQDLKENPLGHEIVPHILAAFGDAREQIPLRTELDDNKGTIHMVQDLHQGDHVRMLADVMMQLNLTLLKLPLSRIQAHFVECLDGISDMSAQVDGCVNGPIRSNSKNSGQLQPGGQNLT